MSNVINLDEYRKRKLREIVDDDGTLRGVMRAGLDLWREIEANPADDAMKLCELILGNKD